jgi:hypothetical protein
MQAKKPSKDESNDNGEESRVMGIVDGFSGIVWDYAWKLEGLECLIKIDS